MAAFNDTRKKRVSKKNKKAWRKHTDTTDIEEFLDNERLEERLGGAFSKRPDDQLFQIDTVAHKKNVPLDRKPMSKKERRRNPKPLRCFEALRNESAIKDPMIKRNRVLRPGEGKKILMARRIQQVIKTHRKDVVGIRDRAKTQEKKLKEKINNNAPNRDLWDEDAFGPLLPGDSTWLRPQTLVHTIQNIAKKIGKKSKYSRVKNSVLPAVEAPHPGESYNPSQKHHEDLLSLVAEQELKLIKYEKHIERVTTKMYGKPSERPTEETRLVEMSEGLPFTTVRTEQEELEMSDTEYQALNPPVLNRKKNKQKRRRLKEAKLLEQQKITEKVEKKKISDIYKLKKLEKELEAQNEEHARLRVIRDKKLAVKALEPKKMSRFKYQAPELDFSMPGELSGNMRTLKTQGNLMSDRFKSLQKRNVIETRLKQKVKRKYKTKRFTKNSHKEEEEAKPTKISK